MDLSQNKLTRSEWESIEVPVSVSEKQILQMITDGYSNINIRLNESQSLFSFIKIEQNEEVELFLYKTYFEENLLKYINKYGKNTPLLEHLSNLKNQKNGNNHIKKVDSIRIKNLADNIKTNKKFIFEFLLIELLEELLYKLHKNNNEYSFYLYTIIQLSKVNINKINKYITEIINIIVTHTNQFVRPSEIILNAYKFIELNNYLLKYEDKELFSHQKEIFNIGASDIRKMNIDKQNKINEQLLIDKTYEYDDDDNTIYPKLILYTAPTGTGKTLTPVGLSEDYRIIFVCAARHIGMALAKSAISIEKKVAFAFGCDTASDIRLHYYSAIDYSKNTRTGGIWKVDNSNGKNVEIIVCDAKSYITAMHYMLAFNHKSKIITYLDEPTIALDVESHPLHEIIHNNWKQNLIPNIILSCATLPEMDELQPIFSDFRNTFDNAEIYNVTSYDCKKSIPIINKKGLCMLPHYMYDSYSELYNCINYCNKNKTLLRYFDLREIINFIKYINDNKLMDESYLIDNYYSGNINDITMNSLKEYYLNILLHIDVDKWPEIYTHMQNERKYRFYGTNNIPSMGVYATTSDAHTLTDGPTIYLVDDIEKIGTFYIQQSKIDANVFERLMNKIIYNNNINDKIDKFERIISAKEDKFDDNDTMSKKSMNKDRVSKESQIMLDEIAKMQKTLQQITLNPVYLPNTVLHQEKWAPYGKVNEKSFISNIDDETCKQIMMLKIDNKFKLLLLLGIGMFTKNTENTKYMEIMKKLAEQQYLFMIIASTDYIYGTNYQFCHGYIGKDLTDITQQKTLQAMGRIGRNNIQQDYTIRFRDDTMIYALFTRPVINIEAINMCKLFNCDEE
jgi:hypothetical protein